MTKIIEINNCYSCPFGQRKDGDIEMTDRKVCRFNGNRACDTPPTLEFPTPCRDCDSRPTTSSPSSYGASRTFRSTITARLSANLPHISVSNRKHG